MNKTVLIIDGGGRGAVLSKAYLKSNKVKKVIVIPGNDLMTLNKNVKIYSKIKTTDIREITEIAKESHVDLADVAQDDAVATGLTDALKKIGIHTFGPTKKAGQIEWDKAWSRRFMKKFDIPTPKYKICKTQAQGISFIRKQKDSKWFIKASGLAAGKGALYAKNNMQAIEKIKQMKKFGKAGETYLIEECLIGEEFSSFAIVSNKIFSVVGHAQDHKTIFDKNKGANTGGMGCSSPPLAITPKIEKQINSIFTKTVKALSKIGRPYSGILYLGGIILENRKVSIIEFNSRWGDPEAQVLIPALKNDFYDLISNAAKGKLQKIRRDNKYRVVVAATSKGYPSNYQKVIGKEIKGLNKIKVFGAGVSIRGKKLVADGGRLFYILGEGKDVIEARKQAYTFLSKVSITGNNLHFRRDIGYQDLERLNR